MQNKDIVKSMTEELNKMVDGCKKESTEPTVQQQIDLLSARIDSLLRTVHTEMEANKQAKEKAVEGVDGMVEAFKSRIDNLEQKVSFLTKKVDEYLFNEVGE